MGEYSVKLKGLSAKRYFNNITAMLEGNHDFQVLIILVNVLNSTIYTNCKPQTADLTWRIQVPLLT